MNHLAPLIPGPVSRAPGGGFYLPGRRLPLSPANDNRLPKWGRPANDNLPGRGSYGAAFIDAAEAGGRLPAGLLRRALRFAPFIGAAVSIAELLEWYRNPGLAGAPYALPPGWTKCATPSCDGAADYGVWGSNTSCLAQAACPVGQAGGVAGSTRLPWGQVHPTRLGLLAYEWTSGNPADATFRGTIRAQFVRSSAAITTMPYVIPIGVPATYPLEVPFVPALNPMALPINTPVPAPKPIPVRWSPAIRPLPDPLVQPVPVPVSPPAPIKVPGTANVPGYAWVPAVGGTATRPALQPHFRGKPPRGNKPDKKPKYRGAFGAMLFAVANAVTEGADLIDAVWWAIPADKRTPWGSIPDKLGDIAGYLMFVEAEARNGNTKPLLDFIDDSIENAVINHISDKVIGSLASGATKGLVGSGLYGSPVGPTAGPLH